MFLDMKVESISAITRKLIHTFYQKVDLSLLNQLRAIKVLKLLLELSKRVQLPQRHIQSLVPFTFQKARRFIIEHMKEPNGVLRQHHIRICFFMQKSSIMCRLL